MKEDKVHVK